MNPTVKTIETEVLSDNWYTLRKITFDYQARLEGPWERMEREAYDRGNGAAILLYNRQRQTVILTRQFRMPTYVNGNADGMLIEACAGLLETDNAEECIRKETEEETGYQVRDVRKVFEAYMSPGSVTEILHYFVAEYDPTMKIGAGGGLAEEQEYIEVLELPFTEAYAMIKDGRIRDGKTILLLQYAKLENLFGEIA